MSVNSENEDSPIKVRKNRVALLESDDEDSSECPRTHVDSVQTATIEENEDYNDPTELRDNSQDNIAENKNEASNNENISRKFKSNILGDSDLESDQNDEDYGCKEDNASENSFRSNDVNKSLRKTNEEESSEDELQDKDEIPLPCNSSEEELEASSKKIQEKPKEKKRTSKQIAEDKMKIHSETERMRREKEVSIPYHRPKQRSLKEFLSRKKSTYCNLSLKSSPLKMIKILKEIEESTKTAPKFFDSESDEEVNITKDKTGNETLNLENQFEVSLKDGVQLTSSEIPVETNANVALVKEQGSGHETINIKEQENVKLSGLEGSQTEDECKAVEKVHEVTEDGGFEKLKQDQPCEDVEQKEDEQVRTGVEKAQTWLNDLMVYEKEEQAKIEAQKRKDKLAKCLKTLDEMKIQPKISRNGDDFIDLDDSKNGGLNPGTKQFMEKFIKQIVTKKQKKVEKDVEIEIMTSQVKQNGEVENIQKEKVHFHYEEDFIEDDCKPGSKLQKLRAELKSKIVEKWKEEYKKREVQTVKDGYEDVADDEDEEEEEELSGSDETESEPEENDVVMVDKKKKKSEFVDEEAEEGDDEMDEDCDVAEESDDECSDGEEDKDDAETYNDTEEIDCSLIPPYQPGGGQLNGGSELTQCNDVIRIPSLLISPSFNLNDSLPRSDTVDLSQSNFENEGSQGVRKMLFQCEDARNSFDDAFGLLSGQFPDSIPTDKLRPDITSPASRSTQDPMKKLLGDNQTQDDDVFDLISGKFESQTQSSHVTEEVAVDSGRVLKRLILPEDSEDEDENDAAVESNEVITKDDMTTAGVIVSSDESDNEGKPETVKRKRKLKFSDDEDEELVEDEEEEEVQEDDGVEDKIVCEEANEEDEVDYDSEENEIVRNPTDFFDKEAELTESEWSGDEDEKGLDMLEMEAGDADVFDQDQVKEQLGKIHMRRVLDEDNREVRILQELLLEDGDLHDDGKGRERKFKWKNIDSFQNDENKKLESGGESEGEEEQDEEWRKSRHEREVFLRQLEQKENAEESSGIDLERHVISKTAKTIVKKNDGLQSPDAKKNLLFAHKRGSFLSRNETFLANLAKTTNNVSDNALAPKYSKNFVFAVKSPEKELVTPKPNKIVKRKSDDPTPPVMKKLKKFEENVKFRRSLSLFDQLV